MAGAAHFVTTAAFAGDTRVVDMSNDDPIVFRYASSTDSWEFDPFDLSYVEPGYGFDRCLAERLDRPRHLARVPVSPCGHVACAGVGVLRASGVMSFKLISLLEIADSTSQHHPQLDSHPRAAVERLSTDDQPLNNSRTTRCEPATIASCQVPS